MSYDPIVYVTWCDMTWSHLNSCSWTPSDIQSLQLAPCPCRLTPLEKQPEYEAGLQQETTCLCEGVAGGGMKRNRKGCEGWGRREGAEKWRERERKGIQKSKGNREKGNKLFSLLHAKVRTAVAISKSIGCQNQLSPGQRFEHLPIQFWSFLWIVDHNQWH